VGSFRVTRSSSDAPPARGEPVEIFWLSLVEDEREAARANGAYRRACDTQGAAHTGSA
jgi:hypothetical protein